MSNRLFDYYSEYLGDKWDRPFTYHGKAKAGTRVQRMEVDVISIVYHGTEVVTVTRQGTVILNTGGWPTVTTKVRMEEALEPIGKRVRIQGSTLRRGVLPRNPKPWVLEVGVDCTSVKVGEKLWNGVQISREYRFATDTAIVEEVFTPYNSYFPVSPFDGKAGAGSRMDDRVTVDWVRFNVDEVL